MTSDWDTTCWCGMWLAHRRDWEVTGVSTSGRAGRCELADRRYQRLVVRWDRRHRPWDVEDSIKLFDRDAGADTPSDALSDLSPPWQGKLYDHGPHKTTRVARTFDDGRLLVETALHWPIGHRDAQLEHRLLSAIHPEDQQADTLTWRAMGIEAELPRNWELAEARALAGRITWRFEPQDRSAELLIERLGMPDLWLDRPLGDWLEANLPAKPRHKAVDRQTVRLGDHETEQLLCRSKIDVFSTLIGRRALRREVAWRCETENRLYRLVHRRTVRGPWLDLPPGVSVTCCKPPPPLPDEPPAPRPGPDAKVITGPIPPEITPQQVMSALPQTNQAIERMDLRGGGAMIVIPLQKAAGARGMIQKLSQGDPARRVRLEAIGTHVLDQCDGTRSGEQIALALAREHKLSCREARLPVEQFLHQMTARGLIGLTLAPAC